VVLIEYFLMNKERGVFRDRNGEVVDQRPGLGPPDL